MFPNCPTVTQIGIQRHAARGYALAAMRLGAATRQYRPSALTMPLEATPYGMVMATFNDDPAFSFKRPAVWDKSIVYGMFDTTDVFSGDLFVTPDEGTFFVTRFEMFRPIEVILCNSVITISGQPGAGTLGGIVGSCALVGAQPGYSSPGAGVVSLATGWPAWIGKPGRGSAAQSGTPGALPAAAFLMRLPLMPGFAPQPYMSVETETGLAYAITGVSSSQYGHECLMTVQQV